MPNTFDLKIWISPSCNTDIISLPAATLIVEEGALGVARAAVNDLERFVCEDLVADVSLSSRIARPIDGNFGAEPNEHSPPIARYLRLGDYWCRR